MCGRFTLVKEAKEIEERFNAKFEASSFNKNYNAAPGTLLSVITDTSPNIIQSFQWGLVPSWAKDKNIAFKTINARIETITEKPAFREAFSKRRCLIPADGYYEWKKEGEEKTPYRITLNDERLFAFAGIWETWHNNAKPLHSFSIITIPAPKKISHLHERMPVILSSQNEVNWLNGTLNTNEALSLLTPPEDDSIDYYTVSKKVNQSSNNMPELIKPFNYPKQGSLF